MSGAEPGGSRLDARPGNESILAGSLDAVREAADA